MRDKQISPPKKDSDIQVALDATATKPKLELTWIGKENRPRLEPRILLEDPELSYHAPQRVSENDIFDNRLVFGDNLLALKALEQEFAGKIKDVKRPVRKPQLLIRLAR